jgi:hypothetical protein
MEESIYISYASNDRPWNNWSDWKWATDRVKKHGPTKGVNENGPIEGVNIVGSRGCELEKAHC